MDIQKIDIDSSVLSNILTGEEFGFFAMLANLINDIMMLHKEMVAYANRYECEIEDTINTYQALAVTISLIGRLYELQKALNKAFKNEDLKKKYKEDISERSKEILTNLESILGSKRFEVIRNTLSNHSDYRKMRNVIKRNLDKLGSMTIILGSDWSLSRFLFADKVRSFAVLEQYGCSDVSDLAAVDRTLTEIIHEVAHCTGALQGYLTEVMNKMLEKLSTENLNCTTIKDVPKTLLSELRIPFFILKDEKLSKAKPK